MPYDHETAARVRAALARRGPRRVPRPAAVDTPSGTGSTAAKKQPARRSPRTKPLSGDITERKMFGGLAFLRAGHMCVGIVGEALMARVGAARHAAALARPHTRVMDFTGTPMTGFVFVDPPGFETPRDFKRWIDWCVEFVDSLPPKG